MKKSTSSWSINVPSLFLGLAFMTLVTFLFWFGLSSFFDPVSLSLFGSEKILSSNKVGFIVALVIGALATYPGFRTIPSVHGALPKLFDSRLRDYKFKEGLAWWPIGFVGSLSLFPLAIHNMNLCFDKGKRLVLADGTRLDYAEISIQWRITGENLYMTSELNDVERFLKESCEDAIRNSAIALTASINRGKDGLTEETAKMYPSLIDENGDLLLEVVTSISQSKQTKEQNIPNSYDQDYLGFDGLYIEQSLVRWKNLILYGKTRNKSMTTKETILSPLEIWRITRRGKAVPEKGIDDIAEEYGLEIVSVTISSTELPEDIQKTINELRLEPTQRKREEMNAETVRTSARNLSPDGKTVDSESLDRAQLEKGTKRLDVHVIRGNGSSADKITAGLLHKSANSDTGGDS